MVVVMLICIINNHDGVTSHTNVYKMAAHTVVEEHDPENKPHYLIKNIPARTR